MRPAVARGAEKTGRRASDIEMVGILICSIHDDEEIARREVAAQIAFYTAPRAYGPMMDASGFSTEAEQIRETFAARDYEGMISAVSDRMIDAIGVAGTAEQVRAGVQRRASDFDHVTLYAPSFTLSLERVKENMRSFIDACAPA